ncbi:RDD family protein [Neolewinella sp.]|uniref:RDD family protein n=1 Tax=Neolewinella sp. TaxID=2993543 RepID=UPI003B51CD3B
MITTNSYTDLPDPTTVPTVGFLPRFLAWFIDQVVLLVLIFPTYYVMVVRPNLSVVVAIWVLQFLYKPLTEARFGATVGKWLLKQRVVDRHTYYRITLNQSFVRYLPFAVSQFASLFVLIRAFDSSELAEVADLQRYVNFITYYPLNQSFAVNLCNNFPVFSSVWMILDPWSRALHDRWAETFVTRKLPTVPVQRDPLERGDEL